MEWRFYGPVLMAVVLFLLVGTIFERRIEAAIRRIIERRQALFENRDEANQPLQQTTEGTQHSCASSEKPMDNKSSCMISDDTLDRESSPHPSPKKVACLDCQSSSLVAEKYLDYNGSSVISNPLTEIEI